MSVDFSAEDYVTYKVLAVSADGSESEGAFHTCSRATALDKDRYARQATFIGGGKVDFRKLD